MTDRFVTPVFTAQDANGTTVPGAQLFFYVTGTTTAKNTFSDAALTTANANPIVADFTGRFGDIFLESGDYKVVLKDADDAVVWTRDPVSGMSTSVSALTDADGDTKVQVEESSDEDIVRIDAAGKEVFTLNSSAVATLTSDDASAIAGPDLTLHRDSASPADADLIGRLLFDGEDAGSTQSTYASIEAQIDDVTDATEDGTLLVKTMQAGTLTTQIDLSSALATFAPPISVDDTTDSTSGTTGSIHTDGGLGVAKDIYVGSDIIVGAVGIISSGAKFRGAAGTAGGPTFADFADDDTGMYFPGSSAIGWASGSSQKMHMDTGGTLYLGDTANAGMTVGLTINQGGNDDSILEFKSSDIAHGITGITETDTFFRVRKNSGAAGGVNMTAYAESGQVTTWTQQAYSDAANTSKSTGGSAMHQIQAFSFSGGSNANLAADTNVWCVKGQVGATQRTLFIIDEDGDFAYDGADGGAYDKHDDATLVGMFNDFLGTNPTRPNFARMKQLSDLRLIGEVSREEWDQGIRPLISGGGMNRLLIGNSVQAHVREQVLWSALAQLVPGFGEMAQGLSAGQNIGALPVAISA